MLLCNMSSFLVFLASIIVLAPVVCSAALEPLPNLHPPASLKTNITSGHVGKPLMLRLPLCDADLGDDLRPASCRNALSKIPRNPGPKTFGERDIGNWDIILPVRYLSGMLIWPFHALFTPSTALIPRSRCLPIITPVHEAQCRFIS